MFVITNRNLVPSATGLKRFGPKPNPLGPNELRMVEVIPTGRGWTAEIVPDVLNDKWKQKAGITKKCLTSMGIADSAVIHGSTYVACRIFARVNPKRAAELKLVTDPDDQGRDLLVFVHGYNNDMLDVVTRAAKFEANFGVEVLAFSWPANGGGATGVASYLSDKSDARISVGALDRTLAKIGDMLDRFALAWVADVQEKADKHIVKKHPKNEERRRTKLDEFAAAKCSFTVNLLLHSMGNYLYKQVLLSTASMGTSLTFDNVILAAADANNKEHALWVDRIKARRRVFITINENDVALRLSRMKLGEEQLPRLGHYPFNLNARHAVYVDFTDAADVGDSHAYFEDEPLNNIAVRTFFQEAVTGEFAERPLPYDPATGMYRMSQDRRSARIT